MLRIIILLVSGRRVRSTSPSGSRSLRSAWRAEAACRAPCRAAGCARARGRFGRMPPTAPGAIGSVSCGCVSRSLYFHKALQMEGIGWEELAPAGGRRRGQSFVPVGAAQPGSVRSFGRNRRFLHFSKLTVRDFAVRRTAAEQRRTRATGLHGARAARSLRRLLFRRHKVLGGLLFAIVAKSLELRTQHRTFHHHAAHLALRIFKLIRD